MSLKSPNPCRSNSVGTYLIDFSFTVNGTSTPDGLTPDFSTDLVLAYSSAGVYTATFAASRKPARARVWCSVAGDNGDVRVNGTYVASTGVLTIRVDVDDGTSGVPAAGNVDNMVINVLLVCSNARPSVAA